ncbi:MAG TPA: glycosyltransferase family 2 protein [Chitinophagaceae bacterium]
MSKFSIVIVAKDSADKIGRLLESVKGLSDDVIVCDTGSSDDTIGICERSGASVHRIPWEGYGKSKNKAIGFSRYDWILSLDSDEKVDAELYAQLQQWTPVDVQTVHQVLWKNFFGNKWIRHSDWGKSWKNRLFHKHTVYWDDAIAHEDVTSEKPLRFVQLNGYLEHYTFKDTKEYAFKMVHSAMITAEKYHEKGKKASIAKLLFSPLYSFFKAYILKLGFLDGYMGWLIAITTSYYTFIKYARLYELNKQ